MRPTRRRPATPAARGEEPGPGPKVRLGPARTGAARHGPRGEAALENRARLHRARRRTTCSEDTDDTSRIIRGDNGCEMKTSHSAEWGLGAPDYERWLSVEALLVPVRWGALALVIVAAGFESGEQPWLTWATVAGLLAANLAVTFLLRREVSMRAVRALGVAVFAVDAIVALVSTFNNAAHVDNVVPLVWVLIIFEGAFRWARPGGIGAGLLAAG